MGKPAPPRTRARDVRQALDALRRIVQSLRAPGGSGRSPLSPAQRFALQQIADHPGASVNEVAALTFTHQSSVSVVVQRLVDRRLVARRAAADDRRRQRLEITAAGRRALRRGPAAVQARLIAAIATLPPRERRALAGSLGRVARVVAPAAAPPPMLFEEGDRENGRRGSQGEREKERRGHRENGRIP